MRKWSWPAVFAWVLACFPAILSAQTYYTVDAENYKLYRIDPNTAVVSYVGFLNTSVNQIDLAWHQGNLYMLDSGTVSTPGRVFQVVTTGAWKGYAIPGASLSGAGTILGDRPGALVSNGPQLIVGHGTTVNTLSWKLSPVNPVTGVLTPLYTINHDCDALAYDTEYWSMDIDNGSTFDWLVKGVPPTTFVGQSSYALNNTPTDFEILNATTLIGPSGSGTHLVRVSKLDASKTIMPITGAQDSDAKFMGIAKGSHPALYNHAKYYTVDTTNDTLYRVDITNLNTMTANAVPIGSLNYNMTDPDLAWHGDALYAIDNTAGSRIFQIVTSGFFAGRAIGGNLIQAPGPADGLASTGSNLVFGYWETNGSSQFWMANINAYSGLTWGNYYFDPDIDGLCYGFSPADSGSRILQFDAGIQYGFDYFVARPLNFNGFTFLGQGTFLPALSPNDIEELNAAQVVGIHDQTRRLMRMNKAMNLAMTPYSTTGFAANSTPTGLAVAPTSEKKIIDISSHSVPWNP